MKKEKKEKRKDFKFELFGSIWSVEFVECIPSEEQNTFYWGKTNSTTRTVMVATKDNGGNPLPEKEINTTLLHEVVHCIFSTGCYGNSNDDEPLVEWTARCLRSLMEQKVLK